MWRTRLGLLGAALLALAACTGDRGSEVASAGDEPGGSPPASAPADDPHQRELQFVACMREEGIDMPDPIPGDTSGRSALLHAIDVQGMGSDPAFQAALEVCGDYLPPPPEPDPPSSEEQARLVEWIDCLRENGLPDVPDPDPATGELRVVGVRGGSGEFNEEERAEMARDGYYLYDADDPTAIAAFEACGELETGVWGWSQQGSDGGQ